MKAKFFFLLLILFASWQSCAQKLIVQHLTCDYRTNPLGVNVFHPALAWQLKSVEKNVMQTSYQILVSDDSILLHHNNANVWNTGKLQSSASIQIAYGGRLLQSAKKYYWKVIITDNKGNTATSKIAFWQMGLLQQKDWQLAKWIAYDALPDTAKIIPHAHLNGKKAWGKRPDVLPLLRKEFVCTKTVKSATAFICGLGHFECFINGKKVGNNFLDPGWTNYSKQALYVTFDVTKMIQKGSNALGVQLGNGFYYIPGERYRKMTGAYGYPKMICSVLVEYTDGTKQNIVSDESWKTAPSPIIFSSIFGGEDYDATKEQFNWNQFGFNDAYWKNAIAVTGHPLQSQTVEPVKVMQEFLPIKITGPKQGISVYDLSQNMSGIPKITVKGNRGDTIKIFPAELINTDGTVNQNATGKPHFYQYILKGEGEETWQPSFSYYGFRYLQIEKIAALENIGKAPSQIIAVKGLHISNSTARIGNFSCSNDLFNATDKLIDWSIKSNMVSLFTDCPHREKLGWLEQTYLVGSSVKYAYDIATLNRKVITDMQLAQTDLGLIPEIAPEFVKFDEPFRDSPEWGCAGIILPWFMYQWYGDKQVLQSNYGMMKKYISYLQTKDSARVLFQGLGDWFDLGPNRPGVSQLTPKGLTATASYYYMTTTLEKIATVLNNNADAKYYQTLSKEIYTAFNNLFFNANTNQYGTGSQTANAMALYMNLVPASKKVTVLKNLIDDIQSRNNALTTGDIGYKYLLKVLSDEDRGELIFAMNNRSDVPGYGYQIAKGATALTESWQALSNVSNNHFMLGHIMEWFYEGLAGIQQSANSVAYKTIVFKPQILKDITEAKAEFQSPYGNISSHWKKYKSRFVITVQVPVNSKAILYLPANSKSTISLDGKIIQVKQWVNSKAVINIGSGSYQFQVVN